MKSSSCLRYGGAKYKVECPYCGSIFTVPLISAPMPVHSAKGKRVAADGSECPGSREYGTPINAVG